MYKVEPLPHDQMISAIREGNPKTQSPKKIIIAGAGMSGLVAGSLLKKAGHFMSRFWKAATGWAVESLHLDRLFITGSIWKREQ